jgi:16S rRNA (uracil1498-N3)-methyltransferase
LYLRDDSYFIIFVETIILMQLFYTHKIEGNFAYLEDAELRHATKTLRKTVGDQIELMDGQGHYYQAEFVEINKKEAQLKILAQEERPLPWSTAIHIAVAPTKNIDRIEWFLEKAVEIGLNHLTPLLCQHSERKRIRTDRLERIALSAAKQSHKFVLPQIDELSNFPDFIKSAQADQKFIAHCYEEDLPHLFHQFEPAAGQSVLILIGPEGDFSPEEVELALSEGYKAISLGKSRLRTETAALAAVHSLQLKML